MSHGGRNIPIFENFVKKRDFGFSICKPIANLLYFANHSQISQEYASRSNTPREAPETTRNNSLKDRAALFNGKICEIRGKMEYKTQTRQKIMDFMAENPDRIFKASEIAQSLPEVSLSTIYRNLSRMEKAGVVQIVGAADNNELQYRYTGPGRCEEKMHLVCKECGKFFHLEGPALKVLQLSVQRSGFELDQQQSVLLGRCSGCSRRKHG